MDANDKLNEMKCASCTHSDGEYFFTQEEVPLCKDCMCEALIEQSNDIVEIQNLDDEDDVELINKLWEEQEHCHKDKK